MLHNPEQDWRRLTALYGEMSEQELRDLAACINDLTEMAQQVLRDELRKRGFDSHRLSAGIAKDSARLIAPRSHPGVDLPAAQATQLKSDLPREYTWKTLLCECDEREQAWQIFEVLRQAGIESWIQGPNLNYAFDTRCPQVLVAADQLELAREIAARPIPQEIIDLSRMVVPEFHTPACPACGTPDPVLEEVDPANIWRCETCGKTWTDATGDPGIPGNANRA